MFTFWFVLICSGWLLYTHFAWYVNGNLPYPPSVFSEKNLYLHALKLFSINWTLVASIVGLAFCIFLGIKLKESSRGVDDNLSSVSWRIIVIFYGVLTLMTLF